MLWDGHREVWTLFYPPTLRILDSSQEASQTAGTTVNLGQRVCRVPAVWPGNPACCLLRRPPLPEGSHLEGCGILAPAPFIYWLEGEGDGKCALEKHRWVCEPATLCLTLDGLRECISQCGPGTSSISNSLGTCEKWTFSWGGWPQTDSIRISGGRAHHSWF